jgi:hypothetical protein
MRKLGLLLENDSSILINKILGSGYLTPNTPETAIAV